jgi:hypothetical protein
LKFSYRQILASAGGAVLSAVIASIFGVKGTIVGVAIGSVAATTGSALLFQSFERTNQAVKHVVVRAPETSVLRRLGGTTTAGVAESEPSQDSTLTEETTTTAAPAEAAVMAASGELPAEDRTESVPVEPDVPVSGRSGLRWPVVAAVVVGVFVFSLLLVTGVELIAGKPLADLFGSHSKGTSVGGVFKSPPTTLVPPTTTTTSPSTTTTTGSSSTTTTTTTSLPGSTSTTSPGSGSTTTTAPSSSTTLPGSPTSTAPVPSTG